MKGHSACVLEDVDKGMDKERELIYGVSFLLPALYGHWASRGEEQRKNTGPEQWPEPNEFPNENLVGHETLLAQNPLICLCLSALWTSNHL